MCAKINKGGVLMSELIFEFHAGRYRGGRVRTWRDTAQLRVEVWQPAHCGLGHTYDVGPNGLDASDEHLCRIAISQFISDYNQPGPLDLSLPEWTGPLSPAT